jgi:hypothetical protein
MRKWEREKEREGERDALEGIKRFGARVDEEGVLGRGKSERKRERKREGTWKGKKKEERKPWCVVRVQMWMEKSRE